MRGIAKSAIGSVFGRSLGLVGTGLIKLSSAALSVFSIAYWTVRFIGFGAVQVISFLIRFKAFTWALSKLSWKTKRLLFILSASLVAGYIFNTQMDFTKQPMVDVVPLFIAPIATPSANGISRT